MKFLKHFLVLSSRFKKFSVNYNPSALISKSKLNVVGSSNVKYSNKAPKLSLHPNPPPYAFILQRYYSDNNTEPVQLKLMDFDHRLWPNLIKTLKNWVYTSFIIRPYLDPEFSLQKMVEGSKLAAEVVSNCISSGKLEELEGLVTADCLAAVKKNLALLNTSQRHEIGVDKKDIYFSFPYEVGILFDDAKGGSSTGAAQPRFVEITVVHHVLRGSYDMIERGEPIPLNVGMHPEFRDKLYILNYRYIRNYTKGVTDQWTLNVINHFKPVEVITV